MADPVQEVKQVAQAEVAQVQASADHAVARAEGTVEHNIGKAAIAVGVLIVVIAALAYFAL